VKADLQVDEKVKHELDPVTIPSSRTRQTGSRMTDHQLETYEQFVKTDLVHGSFLFYGSLDIFRTSLSTHRGCFALADFL